MARSKKKGASKVTVIPRKKVVRTLARGMEKQGQVRRLAGFGAFVDIGAGTDGLLHISELDPNRQVRQITEVLSVGDEITVWIKDLDREQNRISLTMVPPGTKTLDDLEQGMIVNGKVTRLAPYGAFVDIGLPREGMLHVREMADGYVRAPEDVVAVGEELEVRIVELDKRRGRIDLSIKGIHAEMETAAEQNAPEEDPPTLMEIALREAMGDDLPWPTRKGSRKKRQRRSRQREQDEIISRTLETHRQAA